MNQHIKLLLFAAVLAFSSCKKEEVPTVENPEVIKAPSLSLSSDPQFYGKLGGETLSYVATGHQNLIDIVRTVQGSATSCRYISILENWDYIQNVTFKLGTAVYNGTNPETEQNFVAFFAAGTRTFSAGGLDGVYFAVRDKEGVEWVSDGDQTGSTFKIDASQGLIYQGKYHAKVRVSINCKLYSGTEVKNLTEAVFVCYFGKS